MRKVIASEEKMTTIRVPISIARAVKVKAAQCGITSQRFVAEALAHVTCSRASKPSWDDQEVLPDEPKKRKRMAENDSRGTA